MWLLPAAAAPLIPRAERRTSGDARLVSSCPQPRSVSPAQVGNPFRQLSQCRQSKRLLSPLVYELLLRPRPPAPCAVLPPCLLAVGDTWSWQANELLGRPVDFSHTFSHTPEAEPWGGYLPSVFSGTHTLRPSPWGQRHAFPSLPHLRVIFLSLLNNSLYESFLCSQ